VLRGSTKIDWGPEQ
jgi:ribonuclease HI